MTRGDIVLVREPGTPAGKARPCVVIQRSSTMDVGVQKLTVCALTSNLASPESIRRRVAPSMQNGLRKVSSVEVDWVYTHPIAMVGEVIGRVAEDDLVAIDIALRRWLDL